MIRDQALAILSQHREEMARRFGLKRIALFGSTARDEARPDSDVDVLVEFSVPATADAYFGLWEYLETLLGVKVDLATEPMIRPGMRPQVERDLRYVT
jgi:hypothetical protein